MQFYNHRPDIDISEGQIYHATISSHDETGLTLRLKYSDERIPPSNIYISPNIAQILLRKLGILEDKNKPVRVIATPQLQTVLGLFFE